MHPRGGPHLTAEMRSCWHFKLITCQWSPNYTVNIILLHIHITPAWFHHNKMTAIIWADVKKSSNKHEIMKILIAFQSVRWPRTVPPSVRKDSLGTVLLYSDLLRQAGKRIFWSCWKGDWTFLSLVLGCKASLLHYWEEIALSTVSIRFFE